MLETLLYLAGAVVTIVILVRITPPGTSVTVLIALAIAFTAVLAAARHGPHEIVAIIDAIARLIR